MDKQEAIKLVHEMAEESYKQTKLNAIHVDRVVNVISQIDEPEKVVIPRFVAEWIESEKKVRTLFTDLVYYLGDSEEVGNWASDDNDNLIVEKVNLLNRAWLDGYEIEKEKLYIVKIPDPHGTYKICYLARNPKGKSCINRTDFKGVFKNKNTHLTEAEIKENFEWAWNEGFAQEV